MTKKIFIKREIEERIEQQFFKGKVIVIYGARQTGKTTLIKNIKDKYSNLPSLWLNCDEPEIREVLTNANLNTLKRIIGNKKLIFIDETQRIKNIGITLKLLVDNLSDIQLIATGSSSLDLFSSLKEPLTGRKYQYELFPFSFHELENHFGFLDTLKLKEFMLTYGCYPEIIIKQEDAQLLLKNLADSYLYKDLLMYEGIKKHSTLNKLLQAIALQVGSEVNYNELSKMVGIDKQTVEKYLHLLEECFVLFKLPSLSKNPRKEIKKGKKYYFWDVGIRNAIISDFRPISIRPDLGAIWENYIISERIKHLKNKGFYGNFYFWRSRNGKEVDFIEEINGEYRVFEIKWNPASKAYLPEPLKKNYNVISFNVIHNENFYEFLT